MASASFYQAVNFSNWNFDEIFEPEAPEVDPDTVEWDPVFGSYNAAVMLGRLLTQNGSGDITGGTVDEFELQEDGYPVFEITGLEHSAATFWNFLEAGNQGFLAFIFNGSDVCNGSFYDDVLNGFNGADTVIGGGGNDNLNGGAGNDSVSGGFGNDVLNGGAGNDRLLGGDGNDTMIWGTGDSFDGGASNLDALKINGGSLDLTTLANTRILNTETINMAGGGNNILKLAASDVLALSSTSNTVKILGTDGDTVNIIGTQGMGTVVGTFTRYTMGGATFLIDSDIHVV